MKLVIECNAPVESNLLISSEFRIKSSAKSFSILSSGLYSNKIRAIIRELSTNAVDSHIAAGKPNIPFLVHLPSMLEPWFSVQDFGTGLDEASVLSIYTTYFESTKTESNDYTGALGLGSKSPFSYTDNFSITVVKNGIKSIFSAFINQQGIPAVALMSTSTTEESSGLEVKFSVSKQDDYRNFRDEAAEVFRWFALQPEIQGTYSPRMLSCVHADICPGVSLSNQTSYPMAIMGNIAYPLKNIPNRHQIDDTLSPLLESGLVITFPIGALDFAASREELSYIPETMAAISNKLTEIHFALIAYIKEEVSKIDNLWEKSLFLSRVYAHKAYRTAIDTYVIDTKFKLYTKGYGYTIPDYTFDDRDLLPIHNITIRRFTCNGNVTHNQFSTIHNQGDSYRLVSIPVQSDVTIVLDDIKIGAISRIRNHFGKLTKRGILFLISANDFATKDTIYSDFLHIIDNPPTVLKASDLSPPEPVQRLPVSMLKLTNNAHSSYGSSELRWAEVSTPATPVIYYTVMSGRTSVRLIGDRYEEYDIKTMYDLTSKCSLGELNTIAVYGVRKSILKDIEQLPNWVLFYNHVEAVVTNLSCELIHSLISDEVVNDYRNLQYNNTALIPYLNKSSPFIEHLSALKGDNNLLKIQKTIELYRAMHTAFNYDVACELVNSKYLAIQARYPLLACISYGAAHTDIAAYINLIDSSSQPGDHNVVSVLNTKE